MQKVNLWSNSVPRVELDHRARDARLRLERLERLLVPRAVTNNWLGRALYLFRSGRYGEARQGHRTGRPLSNRRPPGIPQIHDDWIGVYGSCCG